MLGGCDASFDRTGHYTELEELEIFVCRVGVGEVELEQNGGTFLCVNGDRWVGELYAGRLGGGEEGEMS